MTVVDLEVKYGPSPVPGVTVGPVSTKSKFWGRIVDTSLNLPSGGAVFYTEVLGHLLE